jgi:L-ribulose-5-phosphate 4-epimerase
VAVRALCDTGAGSRCYRRAVTSGAGPVPASRAEARELVVLFCRRLLSEHLVSYTAGNVSTRVGGEPGLVAVSPASTAYDTLRDEDVVIVTLEGSVVEGTRRPTSELPLHTLAYVDRPDVGGIVHTHSRAAMALAAMGRDLPPVLHGIVSACGGGVACAPYARGGTDEVARFTREPLRDRSACLLRNHGVLAIGPSLEHAYNAASTVEGAADAYLRALAFGPVPEVPADDVERIRREQWAPAWLGSAALSHGG